MAMHIVHGMVKIIKKTLGINEKIIEKSPQN